TWLRRSARRRRTTTGTSTRRTTSKATSDRMPGARSATRLSGASSQVSNHFIAIFAVCVELLEILGDLEAVSLVESNRFVVRDSHFELNSADAAHRSEEHTSELQSPDHLVCRLLLEKK